MPEHFGSSGMMRPEPAQSFLGAKAGIRYDDRGSARNAPRARSWRFPEPIRFGDNAPAHSRDGAHGTVRLILGGCAQARHNPPRAPNPGIRYADTLRADSRHVVARSASTGRNGWGTLRRIIPEGSGKVAIRLAIDADRDADRADRRLRGSAHPFSLIQPVSACFADGVTRPHVVFHVGNAILENPDCPSNSDTYAIRSPESGSRCSGNGAPWRTRTPRPQPAPARAA